MSPAGRSGWVWVGRVKGRASRRKLENLRGFADAEMVTDAESGGLSAGADRRRTERLGVGGWRTGVED